MSVNPQLRQMPDLVLEIGCVRLPGAVRGPAGAGAYHPRLCMCVDAGSGMAVHFELGERGEDDASLAAATLSRAVERLGGLPREIRVRDIAVVQALREPLAPLGVEVVVREALPNLDEAAGFVADMSAGGYGTRSVATKASKGLLDQPGITLDHLIAFADAAKVFYEAAPWRHLSDDDLIEVAAPDGPKGTRFATVLGAGGQTFGLGFYSTRAAHERMQDGLGPPRGGVWTLLFGDIDEMPFADGEVYQQHGIAVAAPYAYAQFVRITPSSRKHTYPTPAELAWAEGLLRALAATTESQIDAGRSRQTVETAVGSMEFDLSLPVLLEQLAAASEAKIDAGDAARKAVKLCAEADAARGRREIQLLRQALQLDPECGVALEMMAMRTPDPADALPWLRRAVDAGRRQLAADGDPRAFLSASHRLALALADLNADEEAVQTLRELLRVDPRDRQGARYDLAQALLRLGRLDELDALLNAPPFDIDATAEWTFTRALLAFRRHGASDEARAALHEAQRSNEFVVPLLTGRRMMPRELPQAAVPRSQEEAALCVENLAYAWAETPGAVEWLESAAKPARRGKKSGPK